MTREEAVNELNDRIKWAEYVDSDYVDVSVDAVKMAISALSVPETNIGDTIYRQAAIDIAMQYCPDDDGSCSKAGADIREMLDELEDMPSADSDLARDIATIIENEKDMRVILKNAQPEPLTDKEQRIFLAAMGREEKVCKQVDEECRNSREPYDDSLVKTCHEITRKVKGACFVNTKNSHLR